MANFLSDYLKSEGYQLDLYNIVDTLPSKMLEYKKTLNRLSDLAHWRTVRWLGCGDQVGYSDNFLDAIGWLAKPLNDNYGTLIGRWPAESYEFDHSLALDGVDFLGLGLDNDNDEELTEERLIIWAELIGDEFKS